MQKIILSAICCASAIFISSQTFACGEIDKENSTDVLPSWAGAVDIAHSDTESYRFLPQPCHTDQATAKQADTPSDKAAILAAVSTNKHSDR